MARIDAVKVQSYVPRYITQIECDMILATPQTPGTLSVATETV